jgi:hypothetical protein
MAKETQLTRVTVNLPFYNNSTTDRMIQEL